MPKFNIYLLVPVSAEPMWENIEGKDEGAAIKKILDDPMLDAYRDHCDEPYRIVAEEMEEDDICCENCIRSIDGGETCLDSEPQCSIDLMRKTDEERKKEKDKKEKGET